jgi:hypothetical protein
MKRNNVLNISGLIMIILGVAMIVLGTNSGPKVLIPPIVTGIGFMVIAWVFMMLKER